MQGSWESLFAISLPTAVSGFSSLLSLEVPPACTHKWLPVLVWQAVAQESFTSELPKSAPRVEWSLRGLRVRAPAGPFDRRVSGAGGSIRS